MAVCWSALPVSITRTVSGAAFLASARNSTPFIPGIRMSETTTANGVGELTKLTARAGS